MILINLSEREERRKFMLKAAKYFEKYTNTYWCAAGEIQEGELMAIRPLSEDGDIIIFRVSMDDVELYPNVIKVEE